jgi:hypothetical protein
VLLGQFRRFWDVEVLPQVPIAMANDLPVGSARVFHYPAAEASHLLIRLDVDRYVAYGQSAPTWDVRCTIVPPTGGCTVHATRGSSMLPTARFWQVHRRGRCHV